MSERTKIVVLLLLLVGLLLSSLINFYESAQTKQNILNFNQIINTSHTQNSLVQQQINNEIQREGYYLFYQLMNMLIAIFSFFMLLGFLIVFFKTLHDNNKILQLQEENEQKNRQLLEHLQLLHEHKKALDESSIVSKTDLHGVITYVNENFCNVSGYSSAELIGKPHNIIRHEDVPKKVFKELWETIKKKEIFHAIIKNKKKNGDFYYVDSTIIPILDTNAEIVEYFAVRHDVTELIKAKEDALSAEKAKSAFLATMSHELRTPLNAVIGFSQILLSKTDFPGETMANYIHKINLSGKHLLNIVNNILDFSKIESQKLHIHKERIALEALINETLLLVETDANIKKIAIEKENFGMIDIFADKQLLKQVLLNIVSNAIKFTSQNKKIAISYKEEEQYQIITICDEGVGLSGEQIKTIFQAFAQIQEHQNEAIKGTGLGLAISNKIIELHQGKIVVESAIDSGSCFNIYLPKTKD
ncbi:MAG: PAS domain-containing sensor histidine kinase [Sulfurimonas sp.]|nr:PAS domain-containing sensor histidine kinase [Sulfurimonas sp.]